MRGEVLDAFRSLLSLQLPFLVCHHLLQVFDFVYFQGPNYERMISIGVLHCVGRLFRGYVPEIMDLPKAMLLFLLFRWPNMGHFIISSGLALVLQLLSTGFRCLGRRKGWVQSGGSAFRSIVSSYA